MHPAHIHTPEKSRISAATQTTNNPHHRTTLLYQCVPKWLKMFRRCQLMVRSLVTWAGAGGAVARLTPTQITTENTQVMKACIMNGSSHAGWLPSSST